MVIVGGEGGNGKDEKRKAAAGKDVGRERLCLVR